MGETFAQRTRSVNASLRRVRAAYRKADSQGELLERELDRLVARKTIVSAESLAKASRLYDEYVRSVGAIDGPFADAIRLATTYS